MTLISISQGCYVSTYVRAIGWLIDRLPGVPGFLASQEESRPLSWPHVQRAGSLPGAAGAAVYTPLENPTFPHIGDKGPNVIRDQRITE